jgi:hypothetical protein
MQCHPRLIACYEDTIFDLREERGGEEGAAGHAEQCLAGIDPGLPGLLATSDL